MRRYQITVTESNGNQWRYGGIYADGFEAMVCAMEDFPAAKRISARRL
jgi:hypothetical protein